MRAFPRPVIGLCDFAFTVTVNSVLPTASIRVHSDNVRYLARRLNHARTRNPWNVRARTRGKVNRLPPKLENLSAKRCITFVRGSMGRNRRSRSSPSAFRRRAEPA
jgi:hypothetical protein